MSNQENQQELPLLSVVVNAYNIEKELLDRCISSVVNQTYSNLEIILVNNRSTDETTGIYCDEWAPKDSRIQVIHRQKSDDNSGREYATGDYIHILDHDDWIHPDMYSKMMSAMLATNSDIARCEFCFVYPDGRMVQRDITHKTDSPEIIGREEGVLLILENKKWQSYRWQNIFKKKLFDHYKTPGEYVFGDLAGTNILFHRALQTVYLHNVFYYYYQRPGSTVHPQNEQAKIYKSFLYVNALYERYIWAKQYPQYHSVLPLVKRKFVVRGLVFLREMIDYPQYLPVTTYKEQAERLRKIPLSLRDIKLFIFHPELLILKILPRCYKPLYRLLRRIYNFIKGCK